MQVTIDQATLARALSLTGRAIPAKSPLPVLSSMLLRADGESVEITASDLQTTIRCDVKATVQEAGSACLAADQLSGFVSGLPSGPLTITRNGSLHGRVVAGKARAKLAGQDPDDYPQPFGSGEQTALATVGAGALRTLLERTAFATSMLVDRPALDGLRLTGTDLRLRADGANGFYMATATVDLIDTAGTFTVLPHRDGVNDLLAILGRINPESSVTISTSGSVILFALEGVTLGCRLVDAIYPDVDRIVPQAWTTKATVSPVLFRNALALVTPFADTTSRQVVCEIGNGDVVLRATEAETGSDGEAHVEGAEVEGEGLRIGFNSQYLKAIVSAFTAETIDLCGTSPTGHVLVRSEADDQLAVIVPSHIGGRA